MKKLPLSLPVKHLLGKNLKVSWLKTHLQLKRLKIVTSDHRFTFEANDSASLIVRRNQKTNSTPDECSPRMNPHVFNTDAII